MKPPGSATARSVSGSVAGPAPGGTVRAWQPVSPDRVPATLFARRKFWAAQFGTAPELPMSAAEMEAQGWESCDMVLETGDAYVDHHSFGTALIGRLLEAQRIHEDI